MAACVRWKIWYDDGSTYASEDGPVADAPSDGVIVIVEKKRDRTVSIHADTDYYFWNGENWVSGHIEGLEKWLRAVFPDLKYGRWTKDGIYKAALEEADQWP